MVLFRSLRAKRTALSLATEIFPLRVKWFLRVYEDAAKKKYGYLYISFDNQADELLMLRSDIFYSLGDIPIVYA